MTPITGRIGESSLVERLPAAGSRSCCPTMTRRPPENNEFSPARAPSSYASGGIG
jgi:hypothetical protein